MKKGSLICFVSFINIFLILSSIVAADTFIGIERIATGLEEPLYVTHAGDGSNRLFVVEKSGRVLILKGGAILEKPFLDISSKVAEVGRETGFLGIAFHPDYKNNGRFFVNYTAIDNNKGQRVDNENNYPYPLNRGESDVISGLKTVIAEYHVSNRNPDLAVNDDERIILEIDQPTNVHNGGQLQFGPDGFLYIGMGDGGPANDIFGKGQDKNTLLGKVLRINVDEGSPFSIPIDNPFVGEEGADEIWAYGFRNPWRFSFDRLDGRLFLADVGQLSFEEVDIVEKGGNYGWNIMEGFHCFPPEVSDCDQSGLILPIAEYSHDEGQAIIGGYVYRGAQIPDLQGSYLFGDFGSGVIWSLVEIDPNVWERKELIRTDFPISSFGEDEEGEVYVVDFTGSVFRIVSVSIETPVPGPTPTPIPEETPAPKLFLINCESNLQDGPRGLQGLVLELGRNEQCVLRLSRLEPGAAVEVSTNLRTGLRQAIEVEPSAGITDEHGELGFTIRAIKRGIDWIAWAIADEAGGFKFDKDAYESGRAWGMFVEVR